MPDKPGYFNRDKYDAVAGISENAWDYENLSNGKATSVDTLAGLKAMDKRCWWNKAWNWTKAGVSTLSDIITVFKVAKVVELGGGSLKVITDSGKEIIIPSKDVAGIPGGVNTGIAVYEAATSKDNLGKQALNF